MTMTGIERHDRLRMKKQHARVSTSDGWGLPWEVITYEVLDNLNSFMTSLTHTILEKVPIAGQTVAVYASDMCTQ